MTRYVHEPENKASAPRTELEADKFAGFVLSKMGAPLEETVHAVALFSEGAQKIERLEAATDGWKKASLGKTLSHKLSQYDEVAVYVRRSFDAFSEALGFIAALGGAFGALSGALFSYRRRRRATNVDRGCSEVS